LLFAPPMSDERRRTVLVVDDSAICRETVRHVLEGGGYRVVELATPFGFSHALNRERPDLVLVDVDMPAISGDQLVSIAKNHKLHRCPMVLHSNSPVERLQSLVQQSGAAGYIVKDGNAESLLRSIAAHISR
jgi:two-component system OmpR family response regulator